MNKKFSLFLTGLILLGLFSSFITPTVNAVPGDLLTPGMTMTGNLSYENREESYGISISEPGVYNVSIYSTGTTSAKVKIFEYTAGYISFLGIPTVSKTANGSTTWKILPGDTPGQTGKYMIQVYITNYDETSSYVVKVEKMSTLGVLQTDVLTELTLDKTANLWQILSFNATSELNAYNFTYYRNDSFSTNFELYDSNGLMVFSTNPSNNTYWVTIIDPGTYYFYIKHSSTGPLKMWFHAIPLNMTVLTPGDSVTVHLNNSINSQEHYLYQLSVEEGKYYDMQLTTENTTNGAFSIFKGPTDKSPSLQFSWWGTGGTENVSDLVFFGEYTAWTDWDLNMTVDWDRTNLMYNSGWESDYVDHSKLVLEIYCNGGDGDATLTISNGTDVPELTTTNSVLATFNNTHGPHWYLYKVPDLNPVSVYTYSIEHTANSNLSTDFVLLESTITNSLYQTMVRPFYPSSMRTLMDNHLISAYTESYNQYDFNYTYEFDDFVSVGGDRWLFIDVPDAVQWASLTGHPLLKGVANISLEERPAVDLTVGTPQDLTSLDHDTVLSAALTPNHHYSVSYEFSNYSNMIISQGVVFNASGYSISALPVYGQEVWLNDNIMQQGFQADSMSNVYIYLPSMYNGPITVLISDTTFSGIVLEGPIFVFGGLGAAVIVGILLGFVFGKAKGKK
ncbi:MAG: hypothetical protein ACTSUV_03425 [Candidatus Ranarchaeia archaeon]